MHAQFRDPLSKQIYDILEKPTTTDLATELTKANLNVDNDMVLLEVGQVLIEEKKAEATEEATKEVPKIELPKPAGEAPKPPVEAPKIPE